MSNKNSVIVGSGLAGLFSAIRLADIFENVYLIEKDSKCGGLLRSIKDEAGIIYDQGTHVPDLTLNEEIDEILFGDEEQIKQDWNILGISRSGNYFNGKLNDKSPMIDTRCLSESLYQKGILQLLELTEKNNSHKLDEYLKNTFGEIFTENVCSPVVEKFYGVNLNQLTTENFIKYIGLSRLIGLNQEVTKQLKKIPVYDDKLAFHSVDDYLASLNDSKEEYGASIYPKKGGVNYWIDSLEKKAIEKGVCIINNEYVKKLNHSGGKIVSIELGESGKTIETDLVVWTAPPNLALQAAGISSKKAKIEFRSVKIFHFNFDHLDINNDLHYLWNWDANYKHYRITLYPNLRKNIIPSQNNISVEVMTNPDDLEKINAEEIYQELLDVKLIDSRTKVLSKTTQNIFAGFPIPTFEFDEAVKDNYQILDSAFNNIMLSGRYGGKSWFHREVVKEIHYEINDKFQCL